VTSGRISQYKIAIIHYPETDMKSDILKTAQEIDTTDWRDIPVDYGRYRLGFLSFPAAEKAAAR
jgi:hypothetical protein